MYSSIRECKTICLLGPTGTGKTSLAISMAKKLDGELVNLDKIYTYKRFSIGTGLSDSLKVKGIKKHLYCLLEPNEEIIAPDLFVKKVKEVCQEINNRNKTAIIEGGSTTYFPALYLENKKDRFIDLFVGLGYPEDTDIKGKINLRLEQMLGEGLIEEIRMGLKMFPDSLIMRDCHFIVPMAKYLKNEIDINEAKKQVVERVEGYIKNQNQCFEKYPNISWVTGKDTISIPLLLQNTSL